jgi:predicted enzyme related to lactoylglutathione lyase
MTTNSAAATAFYTDVVGWSERDSGMPGVDYTIFSAGEVLVVGLMAQPPEPAGTPPGWMGYAQVADVDAGAAQAGVLDGSVCMAPHDIPAWDVSR